MLFHCCLFSMHELNWTLLQISVACGWVLCVLFAIGTIFATYPTFTGDTFGIAGNVLYGCMRHMSWAGAVSWLVYCCCHQYAGIVFCVCYYPPYHIYIIYNINIIFTD